MLIILGGGRMMILQVNSLLVAYLNRYYYNMSSCIIFILWYDLQTWKGER